MLGPAVQFKPCSSDERKPATASRVSFRVANEVEPSGRVTGYTELSATNYISCMEDTDRSSAPWLFVRDSLKAVQFYKDAFGAIEAYRHEGRGGVVARLSIGGSEFWVSDESPEHGNFSPETLSATSFRMLITDPDPDGSFARATSAGAQVVHSVVEGHGWRVGRVVDPFGHHWEIGKQIS